ncbi:glycine-rich domain-containing protein [Chryseobacterium hagamense]|uniref:TIGR04222 domain-containing membrane protein n=1 Tax=Chryseobacterium hagamense TaxID=395935 RepID=A0A511YKD5_9FLAO|nr:hypothetical protein [Chryseobacterium hagamense]GEN75644.1 hypothetical protein CHA01nite_13840 [Chryseobacterium hagamense]
MKTIILPENDLLWNRLRHFTPDHPDAEFPFSRKLAQEQNWTRSFTLEAIEEYKKFIYLCCVLPNGASPSEIVDKVWHLHLTYTQNYWEEFCPDILQRKLHHHPSPGGRNEAGKHRKWFAETLENYRKVFGEMPPEEIWLTKNAGKPFRFFKKYFRFLALLPLLLTVISCSGEGSMAFTGIFFIIIIWGIIRSSKANNKDNDSDGSSCFSGICGGNDSSGSGHSCGSSCGGCGGCGGD